MWIVILMNEIEDDSAKCKVTENRDKHGTECSEWMFGYGTPAAQKRTRDDVDVCCVSLTVLLIKAVQPCCSSGTDSSSNQNEYRKHPGGLKGPAHNAYNFTAICEPIV
jgi:hypothetical protein